MTLPTVNVITQLERSGTIYYHAKWRHRRPDGTTRQIKRTLGPAWLVRNSEGVLVKRRGRPTDGHLDQRSAVVLAQQLMERVELEFEEQEKAAPPPKPTVKVMLDGFIAHREHVKGLRRSTLRDYRSIVDGATVATIAERPADEVTTAEIETLLAGVAESASARTANKYRSILAAAWAWASRPSGLALGVNPAQQADRRREPARTSVDWFSIEEIELLARTLASSEWRDFKDGKPIERRKLRGEDEELRRLSEAQDPQLIRVAAFAGLRLSEIVALRWRDVDFERRAINVRATVSDGKLVDAPKSGKHRRVPMSDRALTALDALSRRQNFTEADDFVAVGLMGERITGDALSKRFKRARDHAGLRPLVFHHLRHTFGSQAVAGGVDLAQVKAAMGHSKIETTERYLHAKSSADVADAFTRAQSGQAKASVEASPSEDPGEPVDAGR
ncbi:MAG: integrase [Patulibacter sp.]|nr:integrase [Patulibacter sp.]